jgi:hypothetical protein
VSKVPDAPDRPAATPAPIPAAGRSTVTFTNVTAQAL